RERTGAVVVTLDEPLVRAETERLHAALAAAGVAVAAVVVNRAGPGAAERWRDLAPEVPLFATPESDAPPAGEDALRTFLESWERLG
ncbi:MAG: hypothetical protein ACRELX_01380, partial [Longimicrobiales bacterium]